MNIRPDAPLFRQQAKEIEPHIPKYYSSIVRHYLPEISVSHIQTVKKGIVVDWVVHCVLAFIGKTKTRIPKNLKIELPEEINMKDIILEEIDLENGGEIIV